MTFQVYEEKKQIAKIGNRINIPHLWHPRESLAMPWQKFVKLITILNRNKGILKPGEAEISEKIDGLVVKFGITRDNEFFLQGSYSGAVLDPEQFDSIKHEPTRNIFKDNFQKIKDKTLPILFEETTKHSIDGVRIYGEWLYSPAAIKRKYVKGVVYFFNTDYNEDKLGTWSTFVLYKCETFLGEPIRTDIQAEIIKRFVDSSDDECKFLFASIPVFPKIDLRNETNDAWRAWQNFKQANPDYQRYLISTRDKKILKQKKQLNEQLTELFLPFQKAMYHRIMIACERMQGLLGDIEGFVIKLNGNEPFIFKVTTDRYIQNTSRDS